MRWLALVALAMSAANPVSAAGIALPYLPTNPALSRGSIQDEFTIVNRSPVDGLWVPIVVDEIASNGLPITSPRDNRSLEPVDLGDLILFDAEGRAIGFHFAPDATGFNTFFAIDPRLAEAPGRFLPNGGRGDGVSHFPQNWISDQPAAFDAWYRAQHASSAVPEPGAALLLGLGAIGLGLARRRASKAAA